MKQLVIISMLFCILGVNAQNTKYVHLQGIIKNFPGGQVVYVADQSDTLSVNVDGTFDWQIVVEKPQEIFVNFTNNQASFFFYAEPGMNANLHISFRKGIDFIGKEVDIAVVDYQGDYMDCFHFLQKYQEWPYVQWPISRLDSLSFTDYRVMLNNEVDIMKAALMRCSSRSFGISKIAWVDARYQQALFRYTMAVTRPDSAFDVWMETINRHDMSQMNYATGYLQWYLRRYAAPEGQSKGIWYLNTLKKVFVEQQMIDYFADNYIKDYLRQTPSDMQEVWECYLQTSKNEKARQEAKMVYEHFLHLQPGTQAPDFEMMDVDGKVWRLSDFRGKAVFIDVWATWCGPCCREIPYVEKLVEHFKDNQNIEFLSISIDRDRKAWLNKLSIDQPQWKQYICQGKRQDFLTECYDIQGIPRFLFIDKKGRVISLMAPRPSSEGIIEYINCFL